MKLTDVSMNSIATLRCRIIESKKINSVITDPMAEYCFEKLTSLAYFEDKSGIFKKILSPVLTNHTAIRARKYDSILHYALRQNFMREIVNFLFDQVKKIIDAVELYSENSVEKEEFCLRK